jgi:predicted CXXCH cytochrome family protein
MKIKYVLETVDPNGLRDRTEKSFDGEGVILGRGSSCDILLSSRLVSFSHAKVLIADESLVIEELEGQAGTTLVNNQAISRGSLVSGDTLKIGDVSLEIEFQSDVWTLFEVRHLGEQLDAKEDIKKQLGLLSFAKRVPSIYFWTLALVTPILIFLLAAPIMGLNEPIWSSGPLTKSHKFLQKDCRSCHEKNFEMVSDKSCKKCHEMGDHVDFLTTHQEFNDKCASCHREHLDEKALILTESELCLQCHADIKKIKADSKYPAMNGFNQTHPEFELIRNKRVDRAKLKLNHKYHLSSIELDDSETGKKRLMVCKDCHVPDNNGEYMDPITFEKYCVSCHKLKMSGAAHMLRVPHVKANLIRTFLKEPEDFLYEYIDSKPDELMEAPKSSGGRRGRGRRSKATASPPVQKPRYDWVESSIEKIEQRGGLLKSENEIFFSAQGGCIECHDLNTSPVGALNSYGSLAAVSLWEHDVRLWDRAAGQDKAILYGHQDIVNSVSFNNDGTQVVTASSDFTARVWNVSDEAEGLGMEVLEKNLSSDQGKSNEASPNDLEGVTKISQGQDGNTKGPQIIESSFVFKGHKGSVNDAVFNLDADKVITGSNDGFAIIWDVNTQKPLQRFQEQKEPIHKVGFNSDGSLAMALSARFSVNVWDVVSGDLKITLKDDSQQIIDVEFSPINPKKIAAAFSDGSIRIYDLGDKNKTKIFASGISGEDVGPGHSLEVTSISYSSDGSKLASVSRDFSAKVWDVNAGKVLATFLVYDEKRKKELKDQRFVSISFNSDGTKVLTGSTDKLARLWQVSSGQLLKEYSGHENAVTTVMFAKKADYILTLSDENFAIMRDLNSGAKVSFSHGGAEEVEGKIFAAAKMENLDEENGEFKKHGHDLRLPKIIPTNVPEKFFEKGFFNHSKHQYLECGNCHSDAKESILTSDLLLPSIKPCQTCHEKQGIQLDRCVVCHFYHPEGERNFMSGLLVPDQTAKLGYSYLRTREHNSDISFFGKK